MSHQVKETFAPTRFSAEQRRKERIEHFGIKLEDIEEEKDSQQYFAKPNQTQHEGNQQGVTKGKTTLMKSETNSNTSDDFTIIT